MRKPRVGGVAGDVEKFVCGICCEHGDWEVVRGGVCRCCDWSLSSADTADELVAVFELW